MPLKLLTVPITFVLAVPIGLFNGLSLPESLLVAAWFTVLVLPVLPMQTARPGGRPPNPPPGRHAGSPADSAFPGVPSPPATGRGAAR